MHDQRISRARSAVRSLGIAAAALCVLALAGCADTPEARSRSFGSAIDDQLIERRVENAVLAVDPSMRELHYDTTSFNGSVLLVGQLPTEDLRQRVGQAAASVENVRRVYNEITVGPSLSAMTRASDALLSSKVKSQLWAQEKIKDGKMEVLTEAGVVYLMGIVSRDQAALASEVTASVSGVQKVVQLFEIIGESSGN